MTSAETAVRRWAAGVGVIALSLAAHTGFGLYGVLLKRLMGSLPPYRVVATAFAMAIPFALLAVGRGFDWRVLLNPRVWVLMGLIITRSLLKLFALQYTLATTVQLIDLVIPFLTPIAAWVWLREVVPSHTFTALAATTLGSFLIIAVDPLHVQLPNGVNDLVGIGLALISSVGMALVVVCMRWVARAHVGSSTVFLIQAAVLATLYGGLSVVTGERWEPFGSLTAGDWGIYVLFGVCVVVGGLTQVAAVSRGSASLFSTLLSWRLVVVLAGGWVLLGESLTSLWQVIGLGVVVAAITLYLRSAARAGRTGDGPVP